MDDDAPGALGRAARWLEWPGQLAGHAACAMMLLVVLVGAGAAGLRHVFRMAQLELGPMGNTLIELQWYLFGFIFLCGSAWTLRSDDHVRVDVLRERLSPRLRMLTDLAGHVVFLLPFCAVLIWLSLEPVGRSWNQTGNDPGSLWLFPVWLAIPLGTALLALGGLGEALRLIEQLRSPAPAAVEAGDE